MTPPDAVQALRGGSWGDFPADCRSAARDRLGQAVCTFDAISFRVVCLPLEVKPAPIVSRGGPYVVLPRHGRSAYRNFFEPGRSITYLGFRVVCLPQEVAPPRAVVRGGCWDGGLLGCRSAIRDDAGPGYDDDLMGFRVVCLQATPQDFTWLP